MLISSTKKERPLKIADMLYAAAIITLGSDWLQVPALQENGATIIATCHITHLKVWFNI